MMNRLLNWVIKNKRNDIIFCLLILPISVGIIVFIIGILLFKLALGYGWQPVFNITAASIATNLLANIIPMIIRINRRRRYK